MKNLLAIVVLLLWYSASAAQNKETYADLNKRLSQARDLKDHKMLGDAYYDLALYEQAYHADTKKSIDYLLRSRERYGLIGDTLDMYKVDLELAGRNFNAGLYDEALQKYLEILVYYDGKRDTGMISRLSFSISEVYQHQGDLDLEYDYLRQAINLNRTANDTALQVQLLLSSARNYIRLNELDSAQLIASEALMLASITDDRAAEMSSHYWLGSIEQKTGNYEQATIEYENAIRCQPSKAYDTQRRQVLKKLADISAKSYDPEAAYRYAMSYASLNDSILNKNRLEASYNLIQKYESLQKQKDIEQLKIEKKYAERTNDQQRRAVYILAAGFALLLLLLYYVTRFYNQQIETEKIITEQNEELNARRIKELEDDIQIRSMQSMIEGQEIERERIAKDLHDSLGGLLSTVKLQFDSEHLGGNIKSSDTFKRAHSLLDHAVTEVRNISQNLQPSALANLGLEAALRDLVNRFSDDHYPSIDLQCYDIPKGMGQMHSLSIYRVIQEMLHNAIKHSEASEILIQINREGDELVIQFEDDGIGFDIENLKRRGMGLGNIRSRIDYLKGTVDLDSTPGEGTSYIIHTKWSA
jgi:signal transduction histidine kinase